MTQTVKTSNAYQRGDTLPPIGIAPDDPKAADVIQLVYARRQAIITSQAKPKRLAASCRKMVAWGEDNIEFPEDCKIVVNKIQQVCFTQAANHLKDQIKATIEPVQTGEYARWYWCGPPEEAMQVQIPIPVTDSTGQVVTDSMTGQPAVDFQQGIDPIYLGGTDPTSGNPIPPQPLPRQLVKQLQALAQMDEIDPQWICQLNDEYTAKTLQKQLDEDWRIAKVDKWAWRTIWANIVEGYELPHYQYDIPSGKHILGRNSIDQTYIDQSVEDIDDAAEAGIDIYMDMDEAIAKYPDQKDAIIRWAYSGSMTPAPMVGTVPEQYREQFRRPLVRKIVWWMRNQQDKMTPQEAIDGGYIQPISSGGNGPASLVGNSQPIAQANSEANVNNQPSVQQEPSPVDVALAMGTTLAVSPTGSSPQKMYALQNGTPVSPNDPAWPTKFVVRQISIIGDAPAGKDWDIECPFGDIPLLHIKNIFVIGKPWGIGEPFGVRNLNQAYSSITNSAVDHADYNAHSAKEMHAGLAEVMEKEYGEAFVNPKQIIKVPAELWKNGEPTVRDVPVSKFSEDSYRIRELLGEDINQIGGRPDVTAGNTPTKNASGQLVAQLSDNAAAPLNFKAQQIVFMFEKLVDLMLYSILHYKPIQVISDTTGVPIPLLSLVLKRALNKAPNIAIAISTGAGAAIERKRANYVQWCQIVVPPDPLVDKRSTREILGLDADVIERRNQSDAKAAILAMPQQQGQPQGSFGSNGNGRH